MGLIETIRQVDLVGLSDADTLSALNATVTLYEDHVLHQWTYVSEALLAQGVSPSIVTSATRLIDAVGDSGALLDRCISSGLDFASDVTRGMIAAANITAPPETVTLLNGMLAIGRPQGMRWQIASNGISTQPTLSEIADARMEIAKRDWCQHVIYDVIPAAMDANGSTIDTIKSAIAGAQ